MFLSGILARGRTRVKAGPTASLARWLRWLAPLGLMAWIFYLSQQAAPFGGASNELESTAAHVVLYATLAALLWWALSTAEGAPAWLIAWQSFALAALYGAIDEVHQAFVAGRTASEADLALDATGALVAVLLSASLPPLLRTGRGWASRCQRP